MGSTVLRHSRRDALLLALAAGHSAALAALVAAHDAPFAPVIAVPLVAAGLWWNANTVAHNFLHLPFFRARSANALFSAYLSLLLGLPQTLWRDRHLAHHAGRPWRWRWSAQLGAEGVLVLAEWSLLVSTAPGPFVGACVAGWLGGLLLCQLQGHYEHVRGTVSHYGALYNLAFFNDGYHVEHHARPGLHWSALPGTMASGAAHSRWPAVLRWLELFHLTAWERVALGSRALQRFMISRHARAFRRLLAALPPVERVTIIGGGLFPRTALVMREVAPEAALTIVDQSAENLRRARPFLGDGVKVVEARWAAPLAGGADLVVVPLAFEGDRRAFYSDPPAPAVAVHDWIWRRRGEGFVISLLLLKRLNLVRR